MSSAAARDKKRRKEQPPAAPARPPARPPDRPTEGGGGGGVGKNGGSRPIRPISLSLSLTADAAKRTQVVAAKPALSSTPCCRLQAKYSMNVMKRVQKE